MNITVVLTVRRTGGAGEDGGRVAGSSSGRSQHI